jgi:hypothetical protein
MILQVVGSCHCSILGADTGEGIIQGEKIIIPSCVLEMLGNIFSWITTGAE